MLFEGATIAGREEQSSTSSKVTIFQILINFYRKLKAAKNAMTRSAPENHMKRIYVGGLGDKLADIQKKDLLTIFQEFGECESIDIYKDPNTGKCRGFAFI